MAKMVGIKEASEITGLSQWELRTGAIAGKYPSLRVGGSRGKIVFNIDVLESHIKKLMVQSTMKEEKNVSEYGKLRKLF